MPDRTAPGPALGATPRPWSRPWSWVRWNSGGFLPVVAAAVLLAAISADHNVAKNPSAEDALFIGRMLADSGHGALPDKPAASFDEEVEQILEVQDAVLRAAPVNDGIPLGAQREPRDLYEAHQGLCYDRSRSIEKALGLLGMETRHVAVYSLAEGRTPMRALLTNGTPSHALTEVWTRRGWMLVDSNDRWIGLRPDGHPVSADALRQMPRSGLSWSDKAKAALAPVFRDDFIHIYGLYSRHGQFYPPMDGIPDVNLAELAQNLP